MQQPGEGLDAVGISKSLSRLRKVVQFTPGNDTLGSLLPVAGLHVLLQPESSVKLLVVVLVAFCGTIAVVLLYLMLLFRKVVE